MTWAMRTDHPRQGGPHLMLLRWEDADTPPPRFRPQTQSFIRRATGRMGVMVPNKQRDGKKSPSWAQNFLF